MDRLDGELVELLRRDARQPVTQLAAILKVSRATVQNRIDRLVANGAIEGFTVRLPDTAEAARVRAVMLLAVAGERMEAVCRALARMPQVRTLHSTNGRWDVIAEIDAQSLEDFDQVLSRSRKIDGVSATETSLRLARIRQ